MVPQEFCFQKQLKNFLSELVVEVCKIFHTQKVAPSYYHPQRVDFWRVQFTSLSITFYIRGQKSERLGRFYPANFVCPSNFNFRSYWRSPFLLFVWSRATPAINAKFLPPAADDLSTLVLDHRKSIVEMIELAQNFGTPRKCTAFTTGNERILRS